MVVSQSNGKIALVSGINGYIGSMIGLQLLQRGYTLRGTARSSKSVEPLKTGAYKEYADRVQAAAVPDITVLGAFDEAVKGTHTHLFSFWKQH